MSPSGIWGQIHNLMKYKQIKKILYFARWHIPCMLKKARRLSQTRCRKGEEDAAKTKVGSAETGRTRKNVVKEAI